MPYPLDFGLSGVASADLGYGGNRLGQQVQDETDEQKKRRMQGQGIMGDVQDYFGALFGGRGGAASSLGMGGGMGMLGSLMGMGRGRRF